MLFFVTWLIIGFIIAFSLIALGIEMADIQNRYLRVVTTFLVLLVIYPASAVSSIIGNLFAYLYQEQTFMEAVKQASYECFVEPFTIVGDAF